MLKIDRSFVDEITTDRNDQAIAGSIIALARAMDGRRERFGDRTIVSAASLGARTIGRTNPFSGDAPLLLANRHQ